MKHLFMTKNLLRLYLVALLIGLAATFNPGGMITDMRIVDIVCHIFGFIGGVYILMNLVLWFFNPVKRDWILVRGTFVSRVLCFVLSVPFAFTSALICFHEDDGHSLKKEIVYDSNLYTQAKDTLMLCKQDTAGTSFAPVYAKIAGWEVEDSACYMRDADYVPVPVDREYKEPHLFWSVYFHFMDAGNQHMSSSQEGRSWAALAGILGVLLLNGLLITTLISYFDRRQERWLNGEVRYGKRHLTEWGRVNFAVVIGANEVVSSVIKNLLSRVDKNDINKKCEQENKYVVLQTCRETEDVRTELASQLTEEELHKVIIYRAARDSAAELRSLCLEACSEIYVLGESTLMENGESFHDALNMRCVNLIADILPPREANGHRKVCKVMFEYQTTYSIFQFSDITKEVNDKLVFIPFNRYESWARRVIVEGEALSDCAIQKVIRYTPLDGRGIRQDSDEHVHFIIIGMSKMGVAMGTQAMEHAHYLNYRKKKTRVTFIDTNADLEMAFFKGRYGNLFALTRNRYINCAEEYSGKVANNWDKPWNDPIEADDSRWKHLADDGRNFIDIELEFVKGTVESDGIREFLLHSAGQENAKQTIAICLTKTHQAIAAGLYLPVELYKSNRLQEVWIYQSESADIIANISHEKNKDLRYKKLRPFGMLYGEYMNDRVQYLKALLVNYAYTITQDKDPVWPENMADKNDPVYKKARASWRDLPVYKKWSNKFFVDSMYHKIKNALYNMDRTAEYDAIINAVRLGQSPNIRVIAEALKEYEGPLAESEHNRWNIEQLLLGYSASDEKLDEVFRLKVLAEQFKALAKEYEEEEGDKKKSSQYSDQAKKYIEMAKEKYARWVKDNNLCIEIKADKFKPKNEVKECEWRIHPNICSYSHMDAVDPGAKPYDRMLNNAIPAILESVDSRPSKTN